MSPYPTTPVPRAGAVLLAALLIALTLLRLIVRNELAIDLHYDEAQYAVWSFSPDWGYYSKPPLIAWVIGGSRALCGDTSFCVRLPAALCFALTPLLIFAIGRELWPFRPGVAWLAAGLFALSPLASFYALFMTTDALLLLLWALALLTLIKALREGGSWWLGLGLALGLGLLAKYTMGVFAVSALLAVVLMPRLRPLLRTRGPWLAMLVAGLVFAPNLWWNAAHGFPTLQHTLEISQVERPRGGLGGLLEFLAAQVVVFGPVALVAAAFGVRGGLLGEAPLAPANASGAALPLPPLRLLACFALPFFLIICLQAGVSRAFANWAAPSYVAGSLLAAAALLAVRWRWLLALALILPALGSALAYGHEALARAAGWQIERPLDDLRGWSTLGAQVEALAADRHATLVVDERRLASELGFYAGEAGRGLRVWNPEGRRSDHFQMTRDLRDAPPGGDFLVVSRRDLEADLRAAFEHAQALPAALQMPGKGAPRPLRVWRVRDFRGYR